MTAAMLETAGAWLLANWMTVALYALGSLVGFVLLITLEVEIRGMTWYRALGTAAEGAQTICQAMLAYNVVSTTAKVPVELQGVFWMDGNAIPEELACLTYASTDSQGSTFLVPKVNGTLSWSYLDSSFGHFLAWFQEKGESTGMQVFAFPSPAVQNGRIWSCTSFNYADINWLTSLGLWSMERLPGPGVDYKRGCYWFHNVVGKRMEFGSYNLRKIMHADGSPVQPAYDDFVRYMETTNKDLKMIMEAPPPNPEGEKALLM